jgi:hypothetical protein
MDGADREDFDRENAGLDIPDDECRPRCDEDTG